MAEACQPTHPDCACLPACAWRSRLASSDGSAGHAPSSARQPSCAPHPPAASGCQSPFPERRPRSCRRRHQPELLAGVLRRKLSRLRALTMLPQQAAHAACLVAHSMSMLTCLFRLMSHCEQTARGPQPGMGQFKPDVAADAGGVHPGLETHLASSLFLSTSLFWRSSIFSFARVCSRVLATLAASACSTRRSEPTRGPH